MLTITSIDRPSANPCVVEKLAVGEMVAVVRVVQVSGENFCWHVLTGDVSNPGTKPYFLVRLAILDSCFLTDGTTVWSVSRIATELDHRFKHTDGMPTIDGYVHAINNFEVKISIIRLQSIYKSVREYTNAG